MVEDKPIALVTGASRGIGAAIADRLAASFFVIGTATTEIGTAGISDRLGKSGTGLILNLASDESINALLESIDSTYGQVAVLVNNAGIVQDGLFIRMSDDDWQKVIQTNLVSLHAMCRPVIRTMIRNRWGRIINIGSVVARAGNPGQTNYVAAKAGIEGFTRALANEIANRGITVNCVAPGFIETDMTANLNERQLEATLAQIPIGRAGTVDEVAALVSFLTTDEAAYITGQTIGVNGGMWFI